MCKYCNGTNKIYSNLADSRDGNASNALTINVTKKGNLSVNVYHTDFGNWEGYFGYDEDDDPIVRHSDMHKRVKINYCPMCGRKL